MTDEFAIMPVMDIQLAVNRRDTLVEFVKGIMVEGTDYGIIPGTDKPTLLKPGAEKLTTFFGLSPKFEVLEKNLDWNGDNHHGEPFFYFQYGCLLYRGEMLVGHGVGSCNSWEKKYRFRTANPVCPECGQEAIIKGKEEYGGGWLCWHKKGGCGKKWSDGAEEIEGQDRGMIKNENPQDLVNTIDKMAQKRSLIAATLIAVNASEFFTQDLEDMEIGTVITPEQPKQEKETSISAPRLKNQWEQKIIDKIMDLQLVQARPHAVNILNQSPFIDVPYGDLDMTEAIGYVVLRSQLKEEFPDIASDERAKVANAAWERGDNEEAIAKAIDMLGEQS